MTELPVSTPSSHSSKGVHQGWRNVILLSVGFGLCFFGCNTYMNFSVPILGNLGSVCMAIVNYVNAFSNFLVPSVISFFGSPERALFWCGFSYLFYISSFSFIFPPLQYVICSMHGFLSAVVWACQGIILGNNSSDSDRGTKSGFFLAIYMLGSAIGNVAASVLVKKLNISNQVHNGWNGGVSILFIFLGCVSFTAVIAYAFIKPFISSPKTALPASPHAEEVKKEEGEKGSLEGSQTDVVVVEEKAERRKPSVLKEIKEVLVLSFKPGMALLLCFFLNCGYQQIFLTSQFTRQLVDLSSVGTLMAVFSIADVIMSNIIGCLCDRCGHMIVLTITIVAELIAFYLSWIANERQNWTIYATGIIFAIADGGFQTECLALVNQYFENDRTNANSVFRMFQCFGMAIALTINPFFIHDGASHSSPNQFLCEIIVAAILGIAGYLGCVVFLCNHKKQQPFQSQPQSQSEQTN